MLLNLHSMRQARKGEPATMHNSIRLHGTVRMHRPLLNKHHCGHP